MSDLIRDFREFILRGNLVDLAVAVVIGTAFGALVASLVADLITPLIAAVFGKQDFSALTFTINGSEFRYGNFINALITFLTVAAVVFFLIVKPVNALLARLKEGEEGEEGESEAPTEDVLLLQEIRDLLRDGRGGQPRSPA